MSNCYDFTFDSTSNTLLISQMSDFDSYLIGSLPSFSNNSGMLFYRSLDGAEILQKNILGRQRGFILVDKFTASQ